MKSMITKMGESIGSLLVPILIIMTVLLLLSSSNSTSSYKLDYKDKGIFADIKAENMVLDKEASITEESGDVVYMNLVFKRIDKEKKEDADK